MKMKVTVKRLLAVFLTAALTVVCIPGNGMPVKAEEHTHTYVWEITKEADDEQEGKLSRVCSSCGASTSENLKIPKTDIYVTMGKSAKIVSGNKATVKKNYKFTVKNAGKYKKYFKINSYGKITTKNNFYTKVLPDIPVKVTVGGKEFTVEVHLELPMTIKTKQQGDRTRFTFKYKLKGAKRIKVRAIPDYYEDYSVMDTYVRKPESNKDSYVILPNPKKIKDQCLIFEITVYHGKSGKQASTFCVDPW